MQLEICREISEEMIREEHLRIAVMLDFITDNWNDEQPVETPIAELRQEFNRHAAIEESVLARLAPHSLDEHRRGHESMSALLFQLEAANGDGSDIRPLLEQILTLFTQKLMPDDAVFIQQ